MPHLPDVFRQKKQKFPNEIDPKRASEWSILEVLVGE